jgi:hypothetical protein
VVPVIRKMRIPKMMQATMTVIPTRNCDHCSCF